MAFIPIPNTVKVALEFTRAGQPNVMTLHFYRNIGWAVASMNTLASALTSWCTTELMPKLHNSLAFVNVYVIDLTTESSPSINWPVTGGVVGGQSVTPTAANTAAVVSFKSQQRGRSFRGRNYIPGVTVAATSDARTLTASFRAELQAAYEALNDVEDTALATHVIASRFTNNAPREVGIVSDVVSYGVGSRLDSQRRRLGKSGD